MKSSTKRKIEDFGIPNLYFVILVCTIVGYILRYAAPQLYYNLVLIPYNVVVGHQYWRLFTWIFTVPYELGGSFLMILILPINLYFYYSIGRRLEMTWGRFMYNLYVIGGAIFTDIFVVIGAYYKYFWSVAAETNRMEALTVGGDDFYSGLSITRYMLMSIFLAFTVVGGDNVVYLYFVIPLKMKWMGYIDLGLLLIMFITGGFFTKIIIFCSITNYFVYFFINKGKTMPTIKDRRRKKKFEDAMKRRKPKEVEYNKDGTIRFPGTIIPPGYGNPEGISIHKCAVCGRTEKDDPNLEFRFCSKCAGNYEYCSEHLYTHQHIN